MQIIRKLLKKNLAKISATRDIVLTLTDTLELFFNDANGNQLKVTDIIICDSKNTIADIENKIPNKFYYAKQESDLGLYINETEGIVYLKADLALKIAQLTTDIEDINNQLTDMRSSIDNSFANVNTTITNLNKQLTDKITLINSTLSSLQSTISNLNSDISDINNDITNLRSSIVSNTSDIENIKTDINAIKTDLTNVKQSINDINTSITGISASITALTNRITNAENKITAHDTEIAANTTAINNIKTSINSKKFNSIYDVENLKKTKLEPELFIPAYIFDVTDELFITKLKLRTRTLASEDITFNITYMPINANGSVSDESSIMEITLPANNYEVNRTIDNSFIKGTGYTNGYLNVYIKDTPIDHPEATLMVSLVVKEGIDGE